MPCPIALLLQRFSPRPAAFAAGSALRAPGSGEAACGARSPVPGARASGRGFTLIELIVVMAIIGILAAIAVPAMRTAPIRAKESALKEDLYQLRSCIDQFHADRDRYPASLDELVSMGYLRQIPIDPITRAPDWVTETPEVTGEETERESDTGGAQGIISVHSASEDAALDGTKYSDW